MQITTYPNGVARYLQVDEMVRIRTTRDAEPNEMFIHVSEVAALRDLLIELSDELESNGD